jgi:inhibitor of KinA sporulation pathway (predicted exonuclease)
MGQDTGVAKRERMHAVVFDLEFTAWEGSMAGGWNRPFELKELVQIGAVKLEASTLEIVDEFECLVRPRVNPTLSDYLVALTGIANGTLQKRGVDFAVAYRAFLDFTGPSTMWAFGRDDLIFEENMRFYGVALPKPPYGNVIPWFARHGVDLSGKHACDVGSALGLVREGRDHDALSDAHSVARGVVSLIRRGAPNPFLSSSGET